MKLDVFEYLVAIEKYRSLNKAAQSLYVSQPNLSVVIKNFEAELGYPVIYRTHQGVQFTEKGRQVLMVAHNIIKEQEKLLDINLDHQRISLKISIGNGDFALGPLFDIINNLTLLDEINVSICNLSVTEAIESIYLQKNNLAYFIIPESMLNELLEYSNSHHLDLRILKELTCQISIGANHPLLADFTFEGLWNYPFVDFINQRPNAYGYYQRFINPKKMIEVDHHSLRRKIVSATNAFTIGIPIEEKIKNDLDIVTIPTRS